MGVAIAFFVYALYDVFSFIFDPSVNMAKFFSSIAIGSILIIIERIFDLRERKEL